MNYKVSLIFTLLLLIALSEIQGQGRAKSMYFYWGYNGSLYSRSNIHLTDEQHYDFELHKVKAEDVPLRNFKDLFSFFSPYNARLGYYITDRISVSLGMDHMKYRTLIGQEVKMTGTIASEASPEFMGNYHDDKVTLSRDLFYMEHTDGLNYLSAEVDYVFNRQTVAKDVISFDFSIGGGAGMMIPRTESYLFDQGANHPFHVAGYGFSVHVYPRVYLGRHFFLQPTAKLGFIHLTDILMNDPELPDRAEQSFMFFQWNLVIGTRIPLSREKRKDETALWNFNYAPGP